MFESIASILPLVGILLLYLVLSIVGIGLVFLSFQQTVSENQVLKQALLEETKRHEQARNCNSIMRLLRQLRDSFPDTALFEGTLQEIKSQLKAHDQQRMGAGLKGLREEQHSSVASLLNSSTNIRRLTESLDLAELILRKIQSSNLEEEDREIVKAEFKLVYQSACRPVVEELKILKTPIGHPRIVPYELLDAAPGIELLENYFTPILD